MDERVNALLPLAAKIAREFGNIPVASGSATTAEARIHGIPLPVSPPPDHAAIHKSRECLEIAMSGLSRHRHRRSP